MVIKTLREYGFNTDRRTYVIAEIGINHGGDVGCAKKLIDAAARAGVDAVKFQTYITEKRVPKSNSDIFDLLKKCELSFRDFEALKLHANQYDVDFFSTPFDKESVSFLESIDCELYKIASFDVVNHQLLYEVAKSKKPIILSVGMSSLDEIKQAYSILSNSTKKIAILHCISSYPTSEDAANLAAIYHLYEHFDCVIGQSDHTSDILVPLYAAAAGAQVLEKHFKLTDDMQCVDAAVSISESQMKCLVNKVRQLELIFGSGDFGIRKSEEGMEIFRRATT
ncbi:N-acetylneuraminate synthase family protein [Thiotrichales bacterium 19S11-10]|nr:N-acetylneuraminate synthase family protein [Thiotrichales bacterium 19S11-10]